MAERGQAALRALGGRREVERFLAGQDPQLDAAELLRLLEGQVGRLNLRWAFRPSARGQQGLRLRQILLVFTLCTSAGGSATRSGSRPSTVRGEWRILRRRPQVLERRGSVEPEHGLEHAPGGGHHRRRAGAAAGDWSSVRQASAVTNGMSAAQTSTGAPARSSACTMPVSGWRGSSGSSQRSMPGSSGSSVSALQTTATRSQTPTRAAAG